mmetsp:Transcript_136458/g.240603  ORF Transcript_136458/g.240603 Transcript_136458/m.240603 type:complete len:1034 (-) Transcript_136458:126-3227(-)
MATRVLPFTQVVTSSPPHTPDSTANKGRLSGALRQTMDSGTQAQGDMERVTSMTAGFPTSQYDVDGNSRLSSRVRVTEPVVGGMANEKPQDAGGPSHRRAIRNDTTRVLKQIGALRREEPYLTSCSRAIVENKFFVAFTTVLTIYALVGDDCRILLTNQPADDYFNVLTISCLVIFTFEIVVSCLGKSDYFLGFFFCLDVISTVTLLLDLTWVSDIVMGDGEDLNKLRSGRTARVGAKAGRVVRVIRLVRILKLYKAVHDARQERQRPKENPELDDWGEDEGDKEKKIRAAAEQNVRESRVGKKLSEMTTRRVILLVLTMLLVMPFLQTDSSSMPPLAAFYAADEVHAMWKEWNKNKQPEDQEHYERALLKYLYYHNWFTGNIADWFAITTGSQKDASSPRDFQSHVFWWGVMSSKSDVLDRDWSAQDWTDVIIRKSTSEAFAGNVSEQNNIYVYGDMPQQVIDNVILTGWRGDCTFAHKNVYRRGLSVIQDQLQGNGWSVDYAVKCPENLRSFEKLKYYPRVHTGASDWHFAFYFDLRPYARQEAGYNLLITLFICCVLCVASLYFSNDANSLVLRPVENMIKRVESISNDPLVAMKMADEEFKTEEREKAKKKGQNTKQLMQKCRDAFTCVAKETEAPMETLILEKTIIKLGSLLALGFGEAGANIIGHNLSSSDSAGVNAMIPGIRVEAIIGYATIRDFSTATEVLKGKVMTFVNQVAEIVHGVVSEFHGAANKNSGDTFLLVWRISGLQAPPGQQDQMITRMADMSVIAFAKILGAVHRSPLLAGYRGHPALQQRLGTDCRVCLTFGLHSGWAIEGAVGTEFKIDASYLSPNVSIAASVENATNFYNVPMLITESVMDLCCPQLENECRKIDKVVIRGSANPMSLYCLDLDYMCLPVEEGMGHRPKVWNSRWRFKARQFLEAEKCRKLDSEVKTMAMFAQCKDITLMRRRYSVEFLQLFNMGCQNYFQGEWQVARRLLSDTRTMLRLEDGPSAALLEFMENPYRFQAPSNWHGYHDLAQISLRSSRVPK